MQTDLHVFRTIRQIAGTVEKSAQRFIALVPGSLNTMHYATQRHAKLHQRVGCQHQAAFHEFRAKRYQEAVVEAEDLEVRYHGGPEPAVRGVTFRIAPGEGLMISDVEHETVTLRLLEHFRRRVQDATAGVYARAVGPGIPSRWFPH